MMRKDVTLVEIYKGVEFIKKKLLELERRFLDPDSMLTDEDYAALVDCEGEKREGRLIPHDELKRELGL